MCVFHEVAKAQLARERAAVAAEPFDHLHPTPRLTNTTITSAEDTKLEATKRDRETARLRAQLTSAHAVFQQLQLTLGPLVPEAKSALLRHQTHPNAVSSPGKPGKVTEPPKGKRMDQGEPEEAPETGEDAEAGRDRDSHSLLEHNLHPEFSSASAANAISTAHPEAAGAGGRRSAAMRGGRGLDGTPHANARQRTPTQHFMKNTI
jgi:hypothetical protein